MKRQLAVVTVDSDPVGVLYKMPHIFTNAGCADKLYAILTRIAKCIDVDGGISLEEQIQVLETVRNISFLSTILTLH
jgi:hypothetical protein